MLRLSSRSSSWPRYKPVRSLQDKAEAKGDGLRARTLTHCATGDDVGLSSRSGYWSRYKPVRSLQDKAEAKGDGLRTRTLTHCA
ncbi:hypothetical protein JYU34_007919 [Plutella xylostella]|uniref:Uncharacterized protein n=1 Tax=Plutella xylostella TaxID=51655 RepID=A0ABQ7QND6_PLUXY|nr:hypothetical protein JYU34_007919 [Plutella xylostella]